MRSLFLALVTLSAMAQAEIPVLQGKAFVDLTIDKSEVTINLPYPFTGKGPCQMEFRSNQSYGFDREFTELTKQIIVEEGFHAFTPMPSTVDGNSVSYDVKSGSVYMTLIKIRTFSGRNLKDVIQDVFSGNHQADPAEARLIVQRVGCK